MYRLKSFSGVNENLVKGGIYIGIGGILLYRNEIKVTFHEIREDLEIT